MKSSSNGKSSSSDRRVSQVIFADAMQSQNSVRLTEVLRRQKWVILVMVSLGLSLSSMYWTRARIWYESTAKVMVSQRDPRMASAGASSNPTEDMVDEDVLANHMEVLRSREIVVAALDRHLVGERKEKLSELPSIREQLTSEDEDAADYVIDHMKLTRGGEGTAKDARSLKIVFEHTNAEDCRLILEAIVVEYQLFLNSQLSKAMSEANTIVEEARIKLETELEKTQQEYIKARESAPVLFQGEGTSNIYVTQYNKLHEELLTLDIEESAIKSRLDKAKAVLTSKKEGEEVTINDLGIIDTDSLTRLGLFAGLQANTARGTEFVAAMPERTEQARTMSEVLTLKAELKKLQSDLGPKHPDVIKLEEQIALFMEHVDSQGAKLNPGWEDVQMTPDGLLRAYIAFLESELTAIGERRTELNALRLDAETQARQLVKFELEEGVLKSRVDRTQLLFDGLVEQLRELDLASGMHGYIHELLEKPRKGTMVWPSLPICAVGGIMLGLIAGMFSALLNDQLDTRFRSSSEIDSAIGLPILTRVGKIKTDGDFPIVLDNSPEGESFRMLRTLLLNDVRSGQLKILSATSPLPGDGKTTILANIAASFAKLNISVVLIEADMRRPTFHKRFGVPDDVGLADLLKGTAKIEDTLVPSGVPNLTLISAGSGAANPSELLQHDEFDQLLKSLSQRFQIVVVDVGPVLAVSDSVIVAQKSDGMLLVVRSANDTKQQVMDAVDALRSGGAKLLGCIVNTYGSGSEFERTGYYGYYYSDRNGRSTSSGESRLLGSPSVPDESV